MRKKKKDEEVQNNIPLRPIEHELGGGYYYTCHWMKCDEQLKKWWSYCPICGQKIDWGDKK